MALLESFKLNKIKLEKFPFEPHLTYLSINEKKIDENLLKLSFLHLLFYLPIISFKEKYLKFIKRNYKNKVWILSSKD